MYLIKPYFWASGSIDFLFSFIAGHGGDKDCLVRVYVDRILKNRQSMGSYQPFPPAVFSFLRIMVKQVKSSSQTSRYQ